ncbi:MAG: flavodoxin domain-containing protein [Anaerovoracaceae bacterium]|jgi:flavodoxin short chain
MSKVAVVYFSGSGNTKQMAQCVADGAEAKGADVTVCAAEDFKPETVGSYDGLAFGCPARGDEELEQDVFRPMWDECISRLPGKRVALFGSFGWGTGEWMQKWEKECDDAGIDIVSLSVICKGHPDDHVKDELRILGGAVAQA